MIHFSIYKNIINRATRLRDFIFDLLFPVECLNCGAEGSWICRKCFNKIEIKRTQYCLHCKRENKSGSFCPDCRARYSLDGVLIAGDYDEKITAKLIKNLKYRFIKDIADDLGGLLIRFSQSMIAGNRLKPDVFKNSLVIPVPLAKRRLRWRGFNQAEEIARGFAEYFNLELSADKLLRAKHSAPQARLKEQARKNNVIGCFAWQGPSLNGRNVILIDDVVTTGATLDECAKILKENGAGQVWGLVVAKG